MLALPLFEQLYMIMFYAEVPAGDCRYCQPQERRQRGIKRPNPCSISETAS